jgi:N-hydroxyarylamine O-acetyltransferase
MIKEYIERIGYTETPRVDLSTLIGIQRAEMAAVAYENLGIHLGRRFDMEENSFLQQIVGERRGGWCYQRNGLLTAALTRDRFQGHACCLMH